MKLDHVLSAMHFQNICRADGGGACNHFSRQRARAVMPRLRVKQFHEGSIAARGGGGGIAFVQRFPKMRCNGLPPPPNNTAVSRPRIFIFLCKRSCPNLV